MMVRFSEDFLFGAATSAHQIEGAWDADGKGESTWDRFATQPGRIFAGQDARVACDHYRRWREDVALMRDLGLSAYRFSIAWPRVLPRGRGPVNEKGLDFYDRLVDELLASGLRPFPTLFHWDLPQALAGDIGGWENRDCAKLFADYAQVVARRLGDRVTDWTTHNEPFTLVEAYFTGTMPPGRIEPRTGYQVGHHLLIGHGLAVQALRATCSQKPAVGIVLDIWPVHPATDSPAGRAAAHRRWSVNSGWLLSAIARGKYPEDGIEFLGTDAPRVEPGDMALVAQKLDFLGVNHYSRVIVDADGNEVRNPDATYTDMGWEIYPEGIFEALRIVQDDYGIRPLYVTENGAAVAEEVRADGSVHDPVRRRYLADYLAQVHRAIEAGVDVRGYFVWSLLDNFEWAHGYSKRFGIVRVDFETQERTIKESGRWYGRLAWERVLNSDD